MSVRTLVGLTLVLAVLGLGASAQDREKTNPPEVKPVPAPYAIDHAKALDAKDEVVAQADDHTQYRVEFTGIKDDRVPGFLYVPKRKGETKTPLPAILLQYGSGGSKTTDYIVAIGKQFVSRGFVVLTIDSPGRGERRKKDEKEGSLGLLSEERVMHYCGDYCRAVDYLASRADVDKERLGYVGISWGAITGITYVAYDPRIKAMGSLVSGGNFLGLFTTELAEKSAKEGSKSSDPVFHVARIAPRPLLFVNVTKDQLIMKSWAESLHKYAGAGSKVMWVETDHYFKGVDRTEVVKSVIDFMDEKMPGKRANP
jgi:dienelactone hydrolase